VSGPRFTSAVAISEGSANPDPGEALGRLKCYLNRRPVTGAQFGSRMTAMSAAADQLKTSGVGQLRLEPAIWLAQNSRSGTRLIRDVQPSQSPSRKQPLRLACAATRTCVSMSVAPIARAITLAVGEEQTLSGGHPQSCATRRGQRSSAATLTRRASGQAGCRPGSAIHGRRAGAGRPRHNAS